MAHFSAKLWIGRGFRLSLIAGVANAAWYAWDVFSKYNMDVRRSAEMKLTFECAAQQTNEALAPYANEYGNINVRHVYCSNRDFLVSFKELADMRAGKMSFETTYLPFHHLGTLDSALVGFVFTMAATLVVVGLISLAIWVWGGARDEGLAD